MGRDPQLETGNVEGWHKDLLSMQDSLSSKKDCTSNFSNSCLIVTCVNGKSEGTCAFE